MKTGQEYFDMMDKETQAKFKANCINYSEEYYEYTMSLEYRSFHAFIQIAFVWDETPEGLLFWETLSNANS